jgi:hypothetical protein
MSVTITSPTAGATLTGTVQVTATTNVLRFELATLTVDGTQALRQLASAGGGGTVPNGDVVPSDVLAAIANIARAALAEPTGEGKT